MSPVLAVGACISLLCALGALLLLRAVDAQEKMARRVASVQRAAGVVQVSRSGSGDSPFRIIAMIGTALARSGLLSDKTVTELEQTLAAAGFRGGNGLGLFVGSKILMLLLLPCLAWFGLGMLGMSPMMHNVGTAVAAIVGLLAPDYMVKSMRKSFLRRLDSGLPDALDMMVICSEAGVGPGARHHPGCRRDRPRPSGRRGGAAADRQRIAHHGGSPRRAAEHGHPNAGWTA